MSIAYGSEVTYNNADTGINAVGWLDSTHIVVAFQDTGGTNGGACVGVIANDDEITWGSEYVFQGNSIGDVDLVVIDSTHFAVAYRDGGDSDKGKAVIGTVASGDEISYGTVYDFEAGSASYISIDLLDSTHMVITYSDFDDAGKGTSVIGVISTIDTITFGSNYTYSTGAAYQNGVTKLDSTHFIVAYRDAGDSNKGKTKIGTVASGDQISFGSEVEFTSNGLHYVDCGLLDSTHVVVTYTDSTDADGKSIIGVISGATITYGTAVQWNSVDVDEPIVAVLDSSTFINVGQDSGGAGYGISRVGVVSGNAITFNDEVAVTAAAADLLYVSAYDATNFAITFDDSGSTTGKGIIGIYTAEPTGTNTQINIGNTWKDISGYQINIGDVWKDVLKVQINIGDTWKDVF